MYNDLAALKKLSTEQVPLPEGFTISDEVWTAAKEWPSTHRTRNGMDLHLCCNECDQSIMVVALGSEAFHYTDDEKTGLKLSHLMQAHGWTRETVGE